MRTDHAPDLLDHVGMQSHRQVHVEAILHGGQVQLAETGGLPSGPVVVEELLQWSAAPQCQGAAQGRRHRARGPMPQPVARLIGQPGEMQRVDVVLLHCQEIPRPLRDQRRPDRLAQPRNVVAEGVACIGRGLVAPETLDEPLDGDDPAGVQREQCHQRPLFRARDVERLVGLAHLDRAEQADSHASFSTGASRSPRQPAAGPNAAA
jgi:hypothetical protein